MNANLRRTVRLTSLGLVAATLPALSVVGSGAAAAPAADAPDLLSSTGAGSIDTSLVDDLDVGDRLDLNVATDADLVGTVREHTVHDKYEAWNGTLPDGGFFSVVRAGSVHRVHVASTEGTWEVAQDKGTPAEVSDVADEAPDAGTEKGPDYLVPPASARLDARALADAPPTGGDPGTEIDLLVVFTPQSVARAGSVANAVAVAGSVVEQTNAIFNNSQIPTRVRLVGTAATAQNQVSTNLRTELTALTEWGDGIYDEVHALRDKYHADQVTLITYSTATPSSCGIGWIGGTDEYAFTATEYNCLSNYTVPHELGHNLGAEHDRYPGVSNTGRTPDAAGWVNLAGRWRTVMAYNNACVAAGFNCVRLPFFSNPAVSWAGAPTGTAAANNARVITAGSPAMANFRQRTIYPGALSYRGSARFKGKLKIKSTAWIPANTAVTYQWFLDGHPMRGATGTKFRPKRRHIGHSLTVLATGSAPYYPAVNAASAPIKVKKGKIKAKRPGLKGKPRVGRVLKVKVKKHSPRKRVKIRFKWYRDGKKIKGAKGRKYRVRGKDRRDKVWCVVKFKKKNFQTKKIRTRKVKIKR